MKNKKWTLLLFGAFILCISLCCNKDKLTKATQTGANTFSCKIDGKTYVAQIQEISLSGAKPIVINNFESNGFILSTIDSRTGESFSSKVLIQLPYLHATGTYPLNIYPYAVYRLNYSPGPYYQTDTSHNGIVNITRCDNTNRIYSGTFSFTAIDKNTGKVIKVTDGRFDAKQ